jgi:hypothetical protein
MFGAYKPRTTGSARHQELFRQLPPERRTDGNPLKARFSRLVGRQGGMPGAAALAPAAA